MKRVGHLWEQLVSDENLERAIRDVIDSHRWRSNHLPNRCSQWLERTMEKRIVELRDILEAGFEQAPPKITERYDTNAGKWRTIYEPPEWPDQCVHHAYIQAIQPVCMRGMDTYCCGSIKGRGMSYGQNVIKGWMKHDQKGTRYCLTADILQCYPSLTPEKVLAFFRRKIKDHRVLDLCWRIIKDGIFAGYYPSQWHLNTYLQPLDVLIHAHKGCKHYVRYMDNFTIFGSNKRQLRRLKAAMDCWLNAEGLQIKGDWQIFATRDRLPDAMGYRYGRGFTIPRKRNYLKAKRAVANYRKRKAQGKRVTAHMAAGILSRIGQLKHCNNYHAYQELLRGERIQRDLKNIVRRAQRLRNRPPDAFHAL